MQETTDGRTVPANNQHMKGVYTELNRQLRINSPLLLPTEARVPQLSHLFLN